MKHYYLVAPEDMVQQPADDDAQDIQDAKRMLMAQIGEHHWVHLATAYDGGPDLHLVVVMDPEAIVPDSWDPLPEVISHDRLCANHVSKLSCAGAIQGDDSYHFVMRFATTKPHPHFRYR